MPTKPHALEQLRIDAMAMGVDLTEFSDEQIHAAFYKAQSVHGLEGLPNSEMMSHVRRYAAGIEKSKTSSASARVWLIWHAKLFF